MSFQIFLLHTLKSNEAENLFGCFYEHQSFMSALGHWTWYAHAQVNCTGNGLMQQLDPKLDGYLGIMDVLIVTGIG